MTTTPVSDTGARSPAATARHALFDAQWADNMQRYPEWAADHALLQASNRQSDFHDDTRSQERRQM
ncbi:MAG: hypothetical protein IPF94_15730 [Betaproteobacteria bacterium]|nr:hypothetical protein [Betaproteobacteria bacterium]